MFQQLFSPDEVRRSRGWSKAVPTMQTSKCRVCSLRAFSCISCSGLSFPGASLKNIVVGASLVRSECCVFVLDNPVPKLDKRLSEASKMLRRLEKGLNTAKMKSHSAEVSMPVSYSSERTGHQEYKYGGRPSEAGYPVTSSPYTTNGLPPISNIAGYPNAIALDGLSNSSRSLDMDDDDLDKNEQPLFPAKMISRENQRNSFFRTILNPEDGPSVQDPLSQRGNSRTPPQIRIAPIPPGLNDPVTAGIITEKDAHVLFDLIFLRLNPFVNLFEPALHTVAYVRSKCPFLFTTLVMAGCKFFRHEDFRACQKLANEFAFRAFAEGWKRVEVVQAFACLTYWKDYDDKVYIPSCDRILGAYSHS